MIRNYAKEWKKYVNFKETTYDKFIEENENVSGYFLDKLNGMLGMLIYERGKECVFQTTTGALISDLPVLNEYYRILSENRRINQIVIAGELISIIHNKILDWGPSQSIVKTSYDEKNKNYVHYFMYDVFELNNKRIIGFNEAISFIQSNFYFKKYKYIHFPEMTRGSIVDFVELYKKSVSTPKAGIEGIVVRTTRRNYKVKPFQSLDIGVIAFGKVGMPAWNKKQISYLVPAFLDKDGIFRTTSKVGTGFTENLRKLFYVFSEDNKVLEEKGVFFVKPSLVVEAYCLSYNINDMPAYKFEHGKYISVEKRKSITLINPRFIRSRLDKKINKEDIRLSQIPEFSEE